MKLKPKLFSEQVKGTGDMSRSLYNFIFERKVILSGYRGSIAHNLHIPQEEDETFGIDDTDFFELYCYPLEYYLSLEGYNRAKEVEEELHDDLDTVRYEIRKVFHLLSECNPNVMLFLYNKPEHYINISEGGKLLLKHKDIFLSRERIRKAFIGYAYDQLSKMAVSSKESAYKGFMGERRRRILDTYGFDTKKATTAIRLMIQGKEFLLNGELKVYRDDDRNLLLNIKKGKYSLSNVQKMAEDLVIEIEKAYKLSTIPETNVKTKINALLVDILKMELGLP